MTYIVIGISRNGMLFRKEFNTFAEADAFQDNSYGESYLISVSGLFNPQYSMGKGK